MAYKGHVTGPWPITDRCQRRFNGGWEPADLARERGIAGFLHERSMLANLVTEP